MALATQWNVSCTTGGSVPNGGALLSIFRFDERGRLLRGDLNGKIYANSDAAWKAALEHGYCVDNWRAGCGMAEHRAWRKAHDAKFDIHYVRLPNGGEFTLPKASIVDFLARAENMEAGALIVPAGKRMPVAITIMA